jgi:hypothetical protein
VGSGGGLAKDVIQREVRRAQPQLRTCYELSLQAQPEAGGKVTVAFQIGPDGHVRQSKVLNSELTWAPSLTCLLRVVDGLEFPPPQGGGNVDITYPLIFRSLAQIDDSDQPDE